MFFSKKIIADKGGEKEFCKFCRLKLGKPNMNPSLGAHAYRAFDDGNDEKADSSKVEKIAISLKGSIVLCAAEKIYTNAAYDPKQLFLKVE